MRKSARATAVTSAVEGIAALRSMGVAIRVTDELPLSDFASCHRGRVRTIVGAITVHPNGRLSADVFDADEVTQRLMLTIVERVLLGEEAEHGVSYWSADGALTTEYFAWIDIDRAGAILEREVLREQLDRPSGCYECGGRVRSFKFGRGGWVCSKCATEPTTVGEVAALRVWQERQDNARNRAEAVDAEEAGDVIRAIECHDRAERSGDAERMAWLISRSAYIAAKNRRRNALRARRAARR